MKYRTFRALVVCGSVAAVAAGGYLLFHGGCGGDGDGGAGGGRSARVGAGPLEAMDEEILRVAARTREAKVKDAFEGRPYKVNLYTEGTALANRLKIDLDRDEKWDEKWELPGTGAREGVRRFVAPADDESYTQEYVLRGAAWVPVPKMAPTPEAEPAPVPARADAAGTVPLRSLDEEVLRVAALASPSAKLKDVTEGRPYKVNLYVDEGHTRPNRVKIDLDRDEKWDEKWELPGTGAREGVRRLVAPADDESYAEEYVLRGGAWARAK